MTLTTSAIKAQAQALGFHKVGITTVEGHDDGQTADRLAAWLALGYHADMAWMSDPKRKNIQACFPEARSLICVALNYYSAQPRLEGKAYAKISRYGWGRDYHRVLQKKAQSP